MRLNPFHRGSDRLLSAGARARRAHAAWLTRALGVDDEGALRIPVRRVDEGGFSKLLSVPGGQERAEQWWFDAFSRADSLR